MNRQRMIQLGALVFVFVALLVLVQVTDAPQDEAAGTPTGEPVQTLLDLDPQQIQLIRVQRVEDGAATILEKDDAGEWVIGSTVAYREVPAPDGTMRELPTHQSAADVVAIAVDTIRLLEDFESDRESGDVEGFCLSPEPVHKIRVEMADGTEHHIEVGCTNPQKTGYYIALRGEPEISLAQKSAVDALLSIVDEPPYLEPTPTPEA